MTPAHRRPRQSDRAESTFVGVLLRSETVGGTVALVAAAVAIVWANLDAGGYQAFRGLSVGPLDLEHWAAEAGLSVFFFVAGLEVKREFLVGSLRRPADAAVPVTAAACGVAVPVLVFLVVNRGTENLAGWAIPAATDIAFALAVLAVVGSALPAQLRTFLLTLAVVDDLIVITIIAVFYSDTLRLTGLLVAAAALAVYAVLQRLRVRTVLLYLPVVVLAWWGVHDSGIHATIAGVLLGLLTRVRPDDDEARSPAERLEHRLVPLSAGIAVPFFALTSAGVAVTDVSTLLQKPLVWGVVLGLVVGKPVGILAGSWLLTRFSSAELGDEVSWRDLTGVALLAGVGFTVSLLVSDLSFADERAEHAKAAVLIGSVFSALVAAVVLRRRNRRHLEAGR